MRPLPLLISKDARFTCHGCGACCRGFRVALEPGEEARIAAYDWRREGGLLAERYFAVEGRGEAGDARRELLRREDGACVFLDDENRCLVERRLGHEAKPRTCRKFPLEFVAAPDGLRALVSVECESRWRNALDGAPLERWRSEIERLVRTGEPYRVAWRVRTAPDGLFLEPDAYLALENALLGAIEVSGAQDRSVTPLLGDLAAVLARARGDRSPAPSPQDAPGHVDAAIAPILDAARACATHFAAEARPGVERLAATPRAWLDALAACDAGPEARAFTRFVLRSWVEAAIPGREPTAEAGLGRMAFGVIVLGAQARTLAPGDRAPSAAELNRAARSASVFLRGRARDPMRWRSGGFAPLGRALRGLG